MDIDGLPVAVSVPALDLFMPPEDPVSVFWPSDWTSDNVVPER
jgi:hypothetical protein